MAKVLNHNNDSRNFDSEPVTASETQELHQDIQSNTTGSLTSNTAANPSSRPIINPTPVRHDLPTGGVASLPHSESSFNPFTGAVPDQPVRKKTPDWVVGLSALGAIAVVFGVAQVIYRPQEAIYRPRVGISRFVPVAESLTKPQTQVANPTAPAGWQVRQTPSGATSFIPAATDRLTVEPGVSESAAYTTSGNGTRLDGTRRPYVDTVSFSDLTKVQVAPGRYEWTGTWEGEGYDRVLDRNERLVSPREGGNDIHLRISLDTTVTDPTKPNLFITVQSDQDLTNQLTNLSAFRVDSETGATLERKDFGQLPPYYDVTVTRSGGFGGTETKTLNPLGTTTFAYHVSPKDLASNFSLNLEGINQLYNQRLMEIYDLEAQGWIVKEVPAPNS